MGHRVAGRHRVTVRIPSMSSPEYFTSQWPRRSTCAVAHTCAQTFPGEVVGLVGDNGAGKSTLIKMVSGVYVPDGGHIYFQGQLIDHYDPRYARDLGIETIYQDLALTGNLDVGANIFMGREIKHEYLGGLVRTLDSERMMGESAKIMDRLDIHIPNLNKSIDLLSGGQRQAVAIARAIYWEAKMLIMDEPTNNLSVLEQRKVLRTIRTLREHGVPVIIISHTMYNIFTVTDRIIVLRRGKLVAERRTAETTTDEIVGFIVGAEEAVTNNNHDKEREALTPDATHAE
jgi:ABC-type sugar transport system ATPase subunit